MKQSLKLAILAFVLMSSSSCAPAFGMNNPPSNRAQIQKTLQDLSQAYTQLMAAETNMTEAQNSLMDGRKLRTYQERALLEDRVQKDQLSIQENLKQTNWDLNYLTGQWGSLTAEERNSVEKIQSTL